MKHLWDKRRMCRIDTQVARSGALTNPPFDDMAGRDSVVVIPIQQDPADRRQYGALWLAF